MDYKNKQLMKKIMFESSFRYHAKKEGYPNLSSDINKLGARALGKRIKAKKEDFDELCRA